MNWTIIVLVLLVLVALDKGLTFINIKLVEKNYPQADAVKIEKNPIMKYSYEKFGLIGGTIVGSIVSLITFLAFISIGKWILGNYRVPLYIIFIIYGFVILNNLYFALKYAKIIT